MTDSVEIRNVNHPEYRGRANATKYHLVTSARLACLAETDGLTRTVPIEVVTPHLPEDVFPGEATAGRLEKTVQLDLEARGERRRAAIRPLRFCLT